MKHTQVVTIRLTREELHLLDWLVSHRCYLSRSDALRMSMVENASRLERGNATTAYAVEGRGQHPPRQHNRVLPPTQVDNYLEEE